MGVEMRRRSDEAILVVYTMAEKPDAAALVGQHLGDGGTEPAEDDVPF